METRANKNVQQILIQITVTFFFNQKLKRQQERTLAEEKNQRGFIRSVREFELILISRILFSVDCFNHAN